jgi:serine/threonine protein kinase/predicted ATPase
MRMSDTVGRYTLVRPLASGGMGDVFLARVTGAAGFTRPAVIKRVRPELRDRGDAVGMFLDEARLSAQLSHPHIVQVFDLGETDDGFYMAMEFVDGVHLGKLMRTAIMQQRPLSVPVCLYICARVAEALHYAHHARNLSTGEPLRVVHRDVSPSNILISRAGDVKLTDFGVAKAQTQQVKTAMGYVKGKVAYLSPEQVELEPIDGRSDVFTLGIVLWELLARMRLYKERDEFIAMDRIVKEPCPRPSNYNPGVPPDAEAICLKALEKKPSDRYPTAGAFQDALDGWLRDQGFFHERQTLADLLSSMKADLGLDEVENTELVRRTEPTQIPLATFEDASVDIEDAPDTIDVEQLPSSADGDPAESRLATANAMPAPHAALEALAAPASQVATVREVPLKGIADALKAPSSTGSIPVPDVISQTTPPRAPLPSFDTRFVGRASELDAMSAHLSGHRPEKHARVLMLCGPEGIGKTRLAVELARRVHAPDASLSVDLSHLDVYYCDLVGAQDLETVTTRLARAIGVSLEVGKNAADAMIQVGVALRPRGEVLLIIDGVDSAAGLMPDLLPALTEAAPATRLLLTGRQPLVGSDVPVFALKPLRQAADDEGAAAAPGVAGEGFDAVDLFVQRMRTLQPSYVLTDEDAATVARIVARLGGNPLAIEIAAGQVAGANVAGLLEKMDDEHGGQGWGESSVSAALDLGLKSLDRTATEALLQAAIFPGQMSVEAARKVLVLPSDGPVDAVLDRLLQRSLVRRERQTVAGIRAEGYRLADGLRERAAAQLRGWPGRVPLEQRFDAFHLEHGEQLAAQIDGPLGAAARAQLAAQLDNLLAVAERQLAVEAPAPTADDALRLALVLDAHFATVGPTTQHLQLLDRAADRLSARSAKDPTLVVRLFIARGQARYYRGWANEAVVDLEDAVARAQQLGQAGLEARALYHLAGPLRAISGSEQARPRLIRAQTLAEAAKMPALEGRVQGALGVLALDDGDLDGAAALLTSAVSLAEDTGDQRAEALATGTLAEVRHAQGDADAAMALAGRALEKFRAIDDRRSEAELCGFVADGYAERGQLQLAHELLQRALRLSRAVGDQRREALLTAAMGALKAELGDTAGARFDLDAAETLLFATGLSRLTQIVELGRGLLDVAEARLAPADDAKELLASARRRLGTAEGASRTLARRLRAGLGER